MNEIIRKLEAERDALRARRDEAESRARTMLAVGDRRGWKDWSDEAYRLCTSLEDVSERINAAYAVAE